MHKIIIHSPLSRMGSKLRAGLDFLLPPRCPHCRTKVMVDGTLCGACYGSVRPISDPQCKQCGFPFLVEEAEGAEGEMLCGACSSSPPAYDRLRSGAHYDGAARRLILSMKQGDGAAAKALARLMLFPLQTLSADSDAILIPVPLHWRRMVSRRFNQAHLLANFLVREAKQRRLQVAPDILRRGRATPKQKGLGAKARKRNVKGAFTVPDATVGRVSGNHFILIDDVYTTGATLSECAKTLKKAGARRVDALVAARVDMGRDPTI